MMSKQWRGVLALAGWLALGASGAMAFDLQGHRGARGLAPENTLEGFATTLGIGVTTLELDIAITRDGVLTVHHDRRLIPDIARGPDGKWIEAESEPIHAMTWAQLQTYDVGRLNPARNYAKRYPAQVPVDGARVPRLADLFALVKKSGNTAVKFAIETKLSPLAPDETPAPEAFAAMLVAEVRKASMEKRTQILSFDWRTLQAVQKIAPEIPTVYLSAQQRWLDNINAGGDSPWVAGFHHRLHGSVPRMIKAAGGTIWSVFMNDLTEALLAEARSLGLKVLVWTVNEPAAMARFLDWKVDGIITDRPDLLRAEMAKRNMALPAATRVTP